MVSRRGDGIGRNVGSAANASIAAIALLGAAGAAACARNPATGERQLSLVPRDQEIALGRQAAADVAQTVGLYQAPPVQAYVSTLGKQLAAKSERPDLPWSFAVVDDPAVNAFALPGGFIFVTRGLLAFMENEAQLAGVLGHEIGHVTGKHGVERISKAQFAQLGLGLALLVSDEARRFGQLGLAGLNLLFLKYGRDDEYEADRLGLRYMARENYALGEMTDVFRVLSRVSAAKSEQGRLPEWLSTHPYPENRIERVEEFISEAAPATVQGAESRARYLPVVDGLVYGNNPRQGFFAGSRFFHPELQFAVQFPADWKKVNFTQAVLAESPGGDAVAQLTVAADLAPDVALRKFLDQAGVTLVSPERVATPGLALPSASAHFAATADGVNVAGLVTFVRHRGRTVQLLTFSRADRLASNRGLFATVAQSFQPVTDPDVLSVQPARVTLIQAPGRMTLAAFYAARGAPVSIESLARLNQMTADTVVEPGQTLKWVRGEPEPGLAGGSPGGR